MDISFSIIITFYKKNKYLEKCLSEISKLNNKKYKFEVILISEINFIPKNYGYPIKYIYTPKLKRPGDKRNIGAKNSSNSILAFIDDDAYPDHKWLKVAFEFYKKFDLLFCLGGPGILPMDDNFQAKLSDQFFTSSIFYPFNERYMMSNKKNKKSVSDWPSVNLFVPKKIFFEVGGFNPKFWPGEDSKLCNDIISKNYKIIYLKNLIVYHYRRSSLFGHIRQIYRYGYHRISFSFDGDKNSLNYIFFIPLLFSIYLLFLPLIIYLNINYLLIPIFIYLLLLFYDGTLKIKKFNFLIVFFSRFIIIISHFIYGIGGFKAIFRKIFLKDYRIKLKR